MNVALAAIPLVASLGTLVFSASTLKIPAFAHYGQGELKRQCRAARIIVVLALIVLLIGPVRALAFGDDGLELALIMAYGAVQVVVLAMQLARLHHIRVASEALL